MSKFVLQDKNTKMIVKSSAGLCLEITDNLDDAAFFKTIENAEKTIKKMYDKNNNIKASKTRYVDNNYNHFFTFNSECHKDEAIKLNIEDAINTEVVIPEFIVREVKLVLI